MARSRSARTRPKGFGVVLARLWDQVALDYRRCPPPLALEPTRSEQTEQTAIKKMFNDLGFVAYYDTSQPHAAQITPGLADLICFDTRPSPWRLFVVEVKARGGWQTPVQRVLEECCRRAGIPYVLGTCSDVATFLGLEQGATR